MLKCTICQIVLLCSNYNAMWSVRKWRCIVHTKSILFSSLLLNSFQHHYHTDYLLKQRRSADYTFIIVWDLLFTIQQDWVLVLGSSWILIRLEIISDIHLEYYNTMPEIKYFFDISAPNIILAGDICYYKHPNFMLFFGSYEILFSSIYKFVNQKF